LRARSPLQIHAADASNRYRAAVRAGLAVHAFAHHLFHFFIVLGGPGLFALSVIDAILFTPLANDVLLVALVSRSPHEVTLYVLLTVAGSTAGCAILDYFSRKGGEAGLKKLMSPRRIEAVKKRISKGTGLALVVATIMPPPFPFTPFVAGASAMQYPRARLLTIIAVSRIVRYGAIGYLAMHFGKRILDWAKDPVVIWTMFGLIVISVVGSVWTVVSKIRQSRC
jgi:membrane protein YqaA with SNARE-associated domain